MPTPTPTLGAGGDQADSIRQLLWDTALAAGFTEENAWIPLTIAWGQSGWDPEMKVEGQEGEGLFLLKDGDDLKDAQANADQAMPKIYEALQEGDKRGLKGEDLLRYAWFNSVEPPGYNENFTVGYDPDGGDAEGVAMLEVMSGAFQDAQSGTIPVTESAPPEEPEAGVFAGLYETAAGADSDLADPFAYQEQQDLAGLTRDFTDQTLRDRANTQTTMSNIFQTIAPEILDDEGKIAAALGRKYLGVTGGEPFPTKTVSFDQSLLQPADMTGVTRDAGVRAAEALGGDQVPDSRLPMGLPGGPNLAYPESNAPTQPPTEQEREVAQALGISIEQLRAMNKSGSAYGKVVRMPYGGTVSSGRVAPAPAKMRQPFEGWKTIRAAKGVITSAEDAGTTLGQEKTGLEDFLKKMDVIVQDDSGAGPAGDTPPGEGIPGLNKSRSPNARNPAAPRGGLPPGPGQAPPGPRGAPPGRRGAPPQGIFQGLGGQQPRRAHQGSIGQHGNLSMSQYLQHVGIASGGTVQQAQGLLALQGDLASGTAFLTAIGDMWGFVPQSLVDQIYTQFLPSGATLGLGGQTQAAKEWEQKYAAQLAQIGVSQQAANNIAAQTAVMLANNKLDNATKLQVAEIQRASAEVTAKIAAGARIEAANIAAEAQKYTADLQYKLGELEVELGWGKVDLGYGELGLGFEELGLGYEELNLEKSTTLADLQANPRRIFEAVALQSNMQPSQMATDYQNQIAPTWSDYAPTSAPPNPYGPGYQAPRETWDARNAAEGVTVDMYKSRIDGVFKQLGGGQHEEGPTMLIVGDKGNKGNKARATEEYVFTTGPTVVAPANEGEEMTMDNAIAAVSRQLEKADMGYPKKAAHGMKRAKSGYPSAGKAKKMLSDGSANGRPLSKSQKGLFGLLASGKQPTKAAHGYTGAEPGWDTNTLIDQDSGDINWNSLAFWVDKFQNFEPQQGDDHFGAVMAFEEAFPEYLVTPGAPDGWQGQSPDTFFDWDAFMADYESGLFGDPASGFFGEPGTMDTSPTPLGQTAIDLAGEPLANQMGETALYDALGGGSPEIQEWFSENFGGLPTVGELNNLSPTQQGVWEGMVSANQIDPTDILTAVGTQFAGFGAQKRDPGATTTRVQFG